jgi:alpha-galactosidase
MVSWTGDHQRHGMTYNQDFHFDVSMSGVLGVGNNITKWSQQEITLAAHKINTYKEIRNTVQNGDLFRLISPFESDKSVLQYVHKNKSETVVFCYQLEQRLKGSNTFPFRTEIIKLKGLKSNVYYTLEGTNQKFMGNTLMEQGLAFPLNKAYSSAILIFKE